MATTDTVTATLTTGNLTRTMSTVPIPDGGSVSSMLIFSNTGRIDRPELGLTISHTQNSQLAASLWTP